MAKAPYYKIDGKKGRARELPGALFDGVVNEAVLHQVVKAYLSNQRQGTASAKNRSAVRGGSRKPWRQKGTGRARQGTIRAPQWTGGGLAFPPQPHGWRQQVPRKVKALARRSALNARAAGERVLLVDALEFESPKTKRVRELLTAMGVEGKALILTDGVRENVVLSARNLPDVRVLPFGSESPYDILWAGAVIIERPALEGWEAAHGAEADAEEGDTPGGEEEVSDA
jgi:large subunit ribosomal protein L4